MPTSRDIPANTNAKEWVAPMLQPKRMTRVYSVITPSQAVPFLLTSFQKTFHDILYQSHWSAGLRLIRLREAKGWEKHSSSMHCDRHNSQRRLLGSTQS